MTREVEHLLDILDPTLFDTPSHRGYSDVTIDVKPALNQTHQSDDPTKAPSHLPHWVLPKSALDRLRQQKHGVTPDILYARGVPNSTAPDLTLLDKIPTLDCRTPTRMGLCGPGVRPHRTRWHDPGGDRSAAG